VTFDNSSEWKFRDNVEGSVDVESEVFADSFNLRTLGLVKVDNCPSLVSSSVVTEYSNSVAFLVFASFNVKNLATLPVDELFVLIFEHLPPSGICRPDLHILCFT
jgi:hypothetical protein